MLGCSSSCHYAPVFSFAGFAIYLEKAYESLNQPFATTKLPAEAAARLVRVGMGLGETELAKDAFELCTTLAPEHLMGHFNYMRTASPWWHGSLAELTAFVDSITAPTLHRLFQIVYLHEVHSFLAHEKGGQRPRGSCGKIIKRALPRYWQGRNKQKLPRCRAFTTITIWLAYTSFWAITLHALSLSSCWAQTLPLALL